MKVVFFIVQLQEFFLLAKTFSQFFLLTNLTMVFCVLEVGFPIRWHASISLGSTCTSMSDKTDMTVLSKLLSGTFSGIPLKTTLFRLPYWAKSLWFDSSMATLFSSFSHFSFSLAFSSYKFLITMSFRLMISFFRPFSCSELWIFLIYLVNLDSSQHSFFVSGVISMGHNKNSNIS